MQGPSDFRYSLVIATLDDDGDLALCLDSLAQQQNMPAFEVIIVDQNGDDHLSAVVQSFASRLSIQHERVDFRGASRARNFGARIARGKWLGFPDDDCQLLPDALHQVERRAIDPLLQVITGQTIDEHGAPNVLRWKQQSTYFSRWNMFGCLTEATLFVQREVFLAVGGFDERFGPGARYPAAEGIELMNRLFAELKPGQACYEPAIKMRHPSKFPPWTRWAAERFHSYAIGDGALIAKNPHPHMLNWGLRTLVSATLQTVSLDGWRSAAFAARLAGMLRGFFAFNLARLTCRD
jgi:glycosyltransferase involved in cell wall biosynthesis